MEMSRGRDEDTVRRVCVMESLGDQRRTALKAQV